MRVLYFVGVLEIGGLERFVIRMSLQARKTGDFEPVVCCLHERRGPFLKTLEVAGVMVYQAPHNWTRNPFRLIEFSRLIRKIAPDVVHSQVNFSLIQQALAVRFAGQIALSITERSEYILVGAAWLRRFIQFHLLQFLGVYYSANNPSSASHVARLARISPEKIEVFHNGVPVIAPDPNIRAKIRHQLGWKSEDIAIGYVSRLAPGKGHELFIRIISRLISEGLPIKVCIAGDGVLKPVLKDMIHNLQLDNAIALPGMVTNVEDYLQAFDFVALLSQREGMPNALLEAMAAGKAIIACPVGGISEMLENGKAGIIVENSESEVLDGIRRLVMNADLRIALGKRAMNRVEECYSMEHTFANLLKHYQKILL